MYFGTGDGSDCAAVAAYEREVAATADPVRAAFDELVGGPTQEEIDLGAASFFSPASAGTVRSADLRRGLLVVDFDDFRDQLANASSSCGSEQLLAELQATAFQFPQVERVRFEIDGSCDAFMNWLQRECAEFDRSGEVDATATNVRADGSGCTPDGAELPAGRWFGFVETAADGELTFDLACWFTGSAAADAAREDGMESPPPNDYHIRNASDRLRTIPVTATAEVAWLTNPADLSTLETIGYARWVRDRSDRSYQPGVWLTITDGTITAIEEQYVP